MHKLDIVIITQEDMFFLPKTIEEIINIPEVNVKHIFVLDTSGALENKKWYFYKLFGLRDTLKMISRYLPKKLKNYIDKLFGYRLFKNKSSIIGLAKSMNINFTLTKNINSKKTCNKLNELKPDIILSFSAPQIFKEKVLNIPKYEVLNVHGSLLPDYRGIMPSFWVLKNGELFSGATIHKMAKNIDEGDILLQKKVDISDCKTIFQVINKTKRAGREIAKNALKMYVSGEKIEFSRNEVEKGRYFSWPKKEDIDVFHRNQKHLV